MTMVTATWPRRTVPPLLKPTPLIPCFSCQWLTMSKMPTTGTSSSFAMSIASATWSEWPWVRSRWVAPAIASPRRAGSKSGLPSQGSRSSTWSSISMRKPLWPSQPSLMVGSSPTSYGSPGRDVSGLVPRGQQLLRADGRELLVRAAERGFERGLPGGGMARLADGGAGRGPGGAGARARSSPAIGVGSWLFHTHARVWAMLADVVPIQVFILVYLALATVRFFGAPWWGGVAAAAAFVPVSALAAAGDRGGGGAAERVGGLFAGAGADRVLCAGAAAAGTGGGARAGGGGGDARGVAFLPHDRRGGLPGLSRRHAFPLASSQCGDALVDDPGAGARGGRPSGLHPRLQPVFE